ncbi:MAG: ATP-binding protein [Snowella sp.]|nr:ATP-binding protein [Snowella sp.]
MIIAIPGVFLLLTLGFWISTQQTKAALDKKIDTQQQIIDQSNRILITLLNAETGIRGYIITRDKRFLEPYDAALAYRTIPLTKLKELGVNDVQFIRQLEKMVNQRLEILSQVLTLTDSPQARPQLSAEKIDIIYESKEAMDSIRHNLAYLEAEKQQLLSKQKIQLENVQAFTLSFQWAAAFVSLVAYLGAIKLLNQLHQHLRDREEELQESKTLISTITTNVVDSVVTVNSQGKMETFNQAAEKVFGYSQQDAIGKDVALLLIDPRSPVETQQLEIQSLTPFLLALTHTWQTIAYRHTGDSFPVEISVSKMDIDGYFLVIIRDITESEDAKAKLQMRADELTRLSMVLAATNLTLEKQNQELDKFAYVASHDLKAPLRAIANLSEWIEEDLQGQFSLESQYQMKLLRGRVYRMEALIDGLLAYSRVGQMQLFPEKVDVGALLENIVQSLSPPPSFTITIQHPMPTLRTKRVLLQQVFFNLIDNAIKHHHQIAGKIRISVEEGNECYQFSVTDDGPGITPMFHERIFTLFQTLQPRDVKETTGIGLAVAKKIVETEGGKIWLESQDGQGSTFFFTWPKESLSQTLPQSYQEGLIHWPTDGISATPN